MTTPSLGRLLISHITLRGPEISQLYTYLASHPHASYKSVLTTFGIPTTADDAFGLDAAPVREALNFLLGISLITQHGTTRTRATFSVTPALSSISFPLLLLHHSMHHPDPRQQALDAVHRHLVHAGYLALDRMDLRAIMERSPVRDLFAWTQEKVSLWAKLYAFCGVLRHPERTTHVYLVPTLSCMGAALWWAHHHHGESGMLTTYLQSIDTTFFACFTRQGRLHEGTAQTLLALERQGYIHLRHESDAAQSILLGTRRVSHLQVTHTRGMEKAIMQ